MTIFRKRFKSNGGQVTDRVNVASDKVMFLWFQDQIVPSEWDDARLRTAARDFRQTIREKTPTGQYITTLYFIPLRTTQKVVINHNTVLKLRVLQNKRKRNQDLPSNF